MLLEDTPDLLGHGALAQRLRPVQQLVHPAPQHLCTGQCCPLLCFLVFFFIVGMFSLKAAWRSGTAAGGRAAAGPPCSPAPVHRAGCPLVPQVCLGDGIMAPWRSGTGPPCSSTPGHSARAFPWALLVVPIPSSPLPSSIPGLVLWRAPRAISWVQDVVSPNHVSL